MKFCPICRSELVLKEIEGKSRLSCQDTYCNFVFWNNPTPVLAAIVEYEGRVILARKSEWPEKFFALIAGFLEEGETPEDGILREVKEELGLEGTIQDLIGHYSYFEKNQIIFVFHVISSGDIQVSNELAEIKFIEPSKLRPWPKGTGPAVRDWLTRRNNNKELKVS